MKLSLLFLILFYYSFVDNDYYFLRVLRRLLLDYLMFFRGIYDKVKGELRLMKEELASIERFRGPKERSLAQCKSNLEAMQTTKEGLESELHQVRSIFVFFFFTHLLTHFINFL